MPAGAAAQATTEAPWKADATVQPAPAEQTAAEAPWKLDRTVGGDLSEKIGTVGQGATVGLVKNVPVLAGAVAGAGIGALGGPAAPITVPLGMIVGGVAGHYFGEGARDLLADTRYPSGQRVAPQEADVPPEMRPYFVGGEALGGSLPYAGLPLTAAQTGFRFAGSRVGSFVNRIIDWAAESPKTFLASEVAGGVGAGAGGFTSEYYFPGQVGPRAAGEVLGGFFNPTRITIGLSKVALNKVTDVISSLSPSGRATQAARILQDIVKQAGEDPVVLAQLLRTSGLPGMTQTSAQLTGSPALSALESKLADESAKFGVDSRRIAEASLESIRNMIVALRGTGDPAALAAAADLRAQYFRTLIAARVQMAEREATDAARKITSDTPQARAELSKTASGIVDQARDEARVVERSLWDKAPQDLPGVTESITGRYDAMRESLLPEQKLPAVVEGWVRRVRPEPITTTVEPLPSVKSSAARTRTETPEPWVPTTGDLKLLRSEMLELARGAAAKGDSKDARIYGNIAEAALSDLDATFARLAPGTPGADAYTTARTFSRELHDVFTRTFAGKSLRTDATGADRIPPETMLGTAFGTGKESGDLRLRQLVEASDFLTNRGLGTPEAAANVGVMLDAQERIVRLAAAEAVNPQTGRVSVTKLNNFLRDNAAILDRFPEVRTNIQAAIKSEAGLVHMQEMATGASRVIESQAAFSKLAKVENPVDAVKNALTGRTPTEDVAAFAKVARQGGTDAVDGLKGSIWDHVIRQATDTAGDVSLVKMRTGLFKAVRPGQPSIAEIMVREKLMTTPEIDRLGVLFDKAGKIERALEGGGENIAALAEATPLLFDTVVRTLGSKGAKLLGGNTLIAQSAGSKLARDVLERVPITRAQTVLIEAAKDPLFAAALLEKPVSQAHAIHLARQVHGYILQAGLTTASDNPPSAEYKAP